MTHPLSLLLRISLILAFRSALWMPLQSSYSTRTICLTRKPPRENTLQQPFPTPKRKPALRLAILRPPSRADRASLRGTTVSEHVFKTWAWTFRLLQTGRNFINSKEKVVGLNRVISHASPTPLCPIVLNN